MDVAEPSGPATPISSSNKESEYQTDEEELTKETEWIRVKHDYNMADLYSGCEVNHNFNPDNGVNYFRNKCGCCARLKQELKCAILELESARETISKLREQYLRDVIEVINCMNSLQIKCSENDLLYSEKYQFQEQKNRLYDRISKFCNGTDEYNATLMEKERVIVLSNRKEKANKPIRVIVNGEVVAKDSERISPIINFENSKRTKCNNYIAEVNKSNKCKKFNVKIIGDSHCKGITMRISESLGDKYEVYGMVKPGAGAAEIVAQASVNYVSMSKEDVVVIQAGSNDVYRNNSKLALSCIVKFCEELTNTNIILLNIPHRYDLERTSCVNNEIQVFNRKLKKVTKLFKHVTILEGSTNRKDYTQHGMHLNKHGKRQVANRIEREIVEVIESTNPISLDWKLEPNRICVEDNPIKKVEVGRNADNYAVNESNKELNKRNKDDYPLNEEAVTGYGAVVEDMCTGISNKSKRIRRVPTTRTEDFLW
jgi:hypothetical protein